MSKCVPQTVAKNFTKSYPKMVPRWGQNFVSALSFFLRQQIDQKRSLKQHRKRDRKVSPTTFHPPLPIRTPPPPPSLARLIHSLTPAATATLTLILALTVTLTLILTRMFDTQGSVGNFTCLWVADDGKRSADAGRFIDGVNQKLNKIYRARVRTCKPCRIRLRRGLAYLSFSLFFSMLFQACLLDGFWPHFCLGFQVEVRFWPLFGGLLGPS